MKKSLVMLMLVVMACLPADSSAQKHRHDPQLLGSKGKADTTVVAVDTLKKDQQKAAGADTVGVEAFSDTTSAVVNGNTWNDADDRDSSNRPWIDFQELPSLGVGEGIVTVAALVFVLLLLLAPFILLGFIVWLIVRNRNQRFKLAEKAMEQGQPIPEPLLKENAKTDTDLWSRGLRNLFLGLGLAALFTCWDSSFLAGLGWLLFFYGLGQVVIAKTTKKREE